MRYMGLIFIICAFLSPGFIYSKHVKYSYPWYIDEKLETYQAVRKYESAFGPQPSSYITILQSDNVLTVESLHSLYHTWTDLTTTELDGYDFQSYCYLHHGHCVPPVSLLSLWGYNFANLPTTNDEILRVVNQPIPLGIDGRLLGICRNILTNFC